MENQRPHNDQFSAEDWLPAAAQDAEGFSGDSGGGYWQHVWRRLAANRRAMLSLALIALLLIFTLLGPLLWRVDPALQSPGLASRGPSWAQTVKVVVASPWRSTAPPLSALWRPASELPATAEIAIVEANTERVRLRWSQVDGARSYRVYRNAHQPRSNTDLGIPLGETTAPEQTGFEDGLSLRPQTYYYSVVATDGVGESPQFRVVAVTPEPAISFLQAQLQGLLPLTADAADYQNAEVTIPAHPLGTDALGRDLLARLMIGAQTSLFIGIAAPLLAIMLGSLYGAAAGYIGGWADSTMMRFVEFVIALPFLLFMILLKVAFGIGPGESGIMPMLVAMVLLSWPSSARLVRGQVLQLREQSYVEAARLMGAGSSYLVFRHMLPNVLGVILVALSFGIPSAIFTEAFLSFIGLGVVPPTPSWGSMSNDGMKTLLSYPRELLLPSLFISITVLSFNLFGDALRDALDSKLERR